jgi:hypothetical protein
MSETQSPLAGLVLFIVCLAIAGTFVAGVHYFTIDLPQQNAMQAPQNWDNDCEFECYVAQSSCNVQCPSYIGRRECEAQCTAEYNTCMSTC